MVLIIKHFSCCFALLLLIIVNFVLLGIRYFYIIVNFLQLYFEVQLSNIQIVWFFPSLILRFIKWDQGSIIFPITKSIPWHFILQGLVLFIYFLSWLLINWTIPGFMWGWQVFPLSLSNGSFPALCSFLTCMPSSVCGEMGC